MGQDLKVPRLSAMMFLEYFVWGAWYATAGLAMTKYGLSSIIGLTYSLAAVSAIIAPFFLGMVADRFFSSEKVLGVLHIIGGTLLFIIPSQMKSANSSLFLLVIFLYMLCFMPTLALTNNVAFHHVEDSARHFPIIRVFGTIGWIAAGIGIGQLGFSDRAIIFTISAVASVLLGIYSFALPHTPAPAKGKPLSMRDLLCLDALKLFGKWNFAVFMICSLLICIPLAAYYSFTSPFLGAIGFKNVGTIMTIGQMLEVIFMLLIPFLFVRLGVKYVLLVGMFAWAVRYGLFAIGAPTGIMPLIFIGIAIHGVCYDFFMVTGSIYAEKQAGDKVKAQAQSLFILFTQGIGMFVGSLIAGDIFNSTVTATGIKALQQWQIFWLIPAGIATVIAVIFLSAFRNNHEKAAEVGASSMNLNTN
ncbi:MFS transporter [Alicyclobacillus pomorum]|uniref:MFS transporter n=1 Tax=Alicyclobacillus pomorum TaxID=204470 RepID=UPI000410AFDD|nr:MFS transporter [Alicyclobacillus pomorum]